MWIIHSRQIRQSLMDFWRRVKSQTVGRLELAFDRFRLLTTHVYSGAYRVLISHHRIQILNRARFLRDPINSLHKPYSLLCLGIPTCVYEFPCYRNSQRNTLENLPSSSISEMSAQREFLNAPSSFWRNRSTTLRSFLIHVVTNH